MGGRRKASSRRLVASPKADDIGCFAGSGALGFSCVVSEIDGAGFAVGERVSGLSVSKLNVVSVGSLKRAG